MEHPFDPDLQLLARELTIFEASKHRKGFLGRCTCCGQKWPCTISALFAKIKVVSSRATK